MNELLDWLKQLDSVQVTKSRVELRIKPLVEYAKKETCLTSSEKEVLALDIQMELMGNQTFLTLKPHQFLAIAEVENTLRYKDKNKEE